jgi:hypothetical protein
MRKRTLGAVLLAGLAMSGAAAFTGSNNMTAAATNTAGYGSATASGVTVTDIDFATVANDESKVDSVTFTTSDNLTGKVARLSLRNAAGAQLSAYDCVESHTAAVADNPLTPLVDETAAAHSTAVCDVTDNVGYASFENVGLTVTDA